VTVLVAYASCYGATRGIAERIAETLTSQGRPAEVHSVDDTADLGRYDAFVIGSALCMFHWRKEAVRFVRRNGDALARRPVWLFSSGPLGTEQTDAQGRDVHTTAGPKELDELVAATHASEHRVFFGAFAFDKLRGMHRVVVKSMPALRKVFAEGDFRDWPEIETWAASIAYALAAAPAPSAVIAR